MNTKMSEVQKWLNDQHWLVVWIKTDQNLAGISGAVTTIQALSPGGVMWAFTGVNGSLHAWSSTDLAWVAQ